MKFKIGDTIKLKSNWAYFMPSIMMSNQKSDDCAQALGVIHKIKGIKPVIHEGEEFFVYDFVGGSPLCGWYFLEDCFQLVSNIIKDGDIDYV
jgi:hypothetical protein